MKRKFVSVAVWSAVFLLFVTACSSSASQTTTAGTAYGKAVFEIKSLDIVPSEVVTGQNATATVVVMNSGTIEGTYAVALRVNGIVLDTKDVTVSPGSTKLATFTISRDTAGTYEIKVEDALASLIVKQGTTTTTTTMTTPTQTTQATGMANITISFDPNPASSISGQIHYKVILTETKGIGVTLKKTVCQFYANAASGEPYIYDTKDWFQGWLPNAYLAPNGMGSFNAGTTSGWTAVTYEFTGTDDNGHDITVTGRLDFSTTTQTTTTTPATPKTPSGAEAVVVVSFDPNPLTIYVGHIYWQTILTETKGVGVTMKSMVTQYYSSIGSLGTSPVFSGPNWGQGFSGAYLPPNAKGSIGSGLSFTNSFMPTYAIFTVTGTDDNGHEITVTGRLDFKQ